MGAGRRTETYLGPHTTNTGSTSATPYLSSQAPFRNLPLGDLAAVIFGCTTGTFKECVTQLIFGLPQPHFRYIQNIQPGLPIFLFSYSDRILHGIFEADSCGELNINPYAWTGGKGLTQFPAQIRVRVNDSCSPLPERVFKPAIIENYQKSPSTHFAFEIDHAQLNRLRSLFKSNTSASNGLHKTSRAGLSSQLNGEDQDGWVTPRKTIKAGLDAWHKAEPFIPTFGQTLEAEDEKRTATPEHWYDYQETIEADKVSENTLNIQGALDDTLNSDVDSRNEESLNWRANMQPSNVVESEGREHSKKERERVVVERLRQLKQKGKQVIVETKAELLDVPGTSNGEASGLVSPEASEVIDFDRTEWEKLARERCLQEQTMLRRVREQLKEKLQAVDEPVARAISMNLELSSSAIAQMRQDEIKLRHLMDQAMSQTELLHELDQLRRKNATLEYTQVKMASEIEGLKSEMSRLSLKIRDIVEQNGQVDQSHQQFKPLGSDEGLASQLDVATGGESWQQIYLLGGYDASSWLDRVDVLYPATYEMEFAAPMSVSRSYAAASVLMGSIYVFGGGNGALWYDTVERYNPETDEWTQCSPMHQQKGSLAGATVGDRIYAIGGGIGKVYFSEVECYDAHLGAWIGSTSMLYKRFGVAATELDGALYAIGGFNDHYLSSVERFDPREALWTAVAPMTRRRGSLSAVTLDGKIYAIGGYDGNQFLKSMECYEPRRNLWLEADAELHTGRAFGTAARAGRDIFIFGGFNGDFLDTVECYKEGSGNGWETIGDILMGTRSFQACAVLE